MGRDDHLSFRGEPADIFPEREQFQFDGGLLRKPIGQPEIVPVGGDDHPWVIRNAEQAFIVVVKPQLGLVDPSQKDVRGKPFQFPFHKVHRTHGQNLML